MTVPDVARANDVGVARSGALALDGRFRVAFVLFGGMVALQSSPTLDATKLAYMAGTVLCLLGASAALWRARASPEVRLAAPWLAGSAALVVLIAVSFFVARANGTQFTDWLRDIAAYALFAAVPVFALDGQASASRKLFVGMLVLAGLLGGLSWAVEWLGRRQIIDLSFARLVFPAGQLPSMLYLFAMATAFTSGRRGALWVLLAGVILGLFLLTGTRSSLLLLISPLVMAALAGRARIRSSVRSFAAHGVVAAAVVLAFQLALALPVLLAPGPGSGDPGSSGEPGSSGDPGSSGEPRGSGSSGATATFGPSVLGNRFGSLPTLIVDPASDPSIKERVAQYQAAWALFVSSPIVGVGPGHAIEWIDVSGYPRTGFTADTPLVMPAKFGLLGILVLLGAPLAYGSTVRTALRRARRSAITLTLVGYGVLTFVGLPLGFPIEDKGTGLALILLLALAFGERAPFDRIDAASSDELQATAVDKLHPGQ